jgi:hypothetical protein
MFLIIALFGIGQKTAKDIVLQGQGASEINCSLALLELLEIKMVKCTHYPRF